MIYDRVMPGKTLQSSSEWALFVSRFSSGMLRKEEWTHGAHLAVGAWFLAHYSRLEAGVRLRTGIRHLNVCLGGENSDTSGFHETLTEFWVELVHRWICAHGASPESIARLIEHPEAASGVWRRCYDFDVPKSKKARRQWVAPARWPEIA